MLVLVLLERVFVFLGRWLLRRRDRLDRLRGYFWHRICHVGSDLVAQAGAPMFLGMAAFPPVHRLLGREALFLCCLPRTLVVHAGELV